MSLPTPPVMNERHVPLALHGFVSAACRSMPDCHDLIRFWGRGPNYRPQKPVVLLLPDKIRDNKTPTVVFIACEGIATAAEIQDLAIHYWGKSEERLAKNKGMLVDGDVMREKFGFVEKAQVETAMHEAMQRRIERFNRNRRTDPSNWSK